MEDTVRRLTKVLGATGVEAIGPDTRFTVSGSGGAQLKVSVEGQHQRFMAVLIDGSGITRTSVDVAPVKSVTEDPQFPGRVTLHFGTLLVHVETKPSLALEVVTQVA
jgi:hypothetical protein